MNSRKFYDTVKAMREAQQKTDFGDKGNSDEESYSYWLSEKTRLEQIIDSEIERVEKILKKRETSKRQIDNAINLLNAKGFGLEKVTDKE